MNIYMFLWFLGSRINHTRFSIVVVEYRTLRRERIFLQEMSILRAPPLVHDMSYSKRWEFLSDDRFFFPFLSSSHCSFRFCNVFKVFHRLSRKFTIGSGGLHWEVIVGD